MIAIKCVIIIIIIVIIIIVLIPSGFEEHGNQICDACYYSAVPHQPYES